MIRYANFIGGFVCILWMMLYLVKREFDNRQHVLALSVRTQTQTQCGPNIHTTSLVGSTLLKGTRKQILNEVAKKKKKIMSIHVDLAAVSPT